MGAELTSATNTKVYKIKTSATTVKFYKHLFRTPNNRTPGLPGPDKKILTFSLGPKYFFHIDFTFILSLIASDNAKTEIGIRVISHSSKEEDRHNTRVGADFQS